MVLSRAFKDAIGNFLFLLALIFVVVLVISLGHLIWFYMRPEDLMGFLYFFKVLLVTLFWIVLILALLAFIIWGIYYLFSDFPHNFTWKNLLKGIGIVIAVFLINMLNFFQLNFFEFKMFKSLADKYEYLEDSKAAIAKKQYNEALSSAYKAYKWANEDRTPWVIFPMTRMYSKTRDARMLKADEIFAATINYGYCLAQFDSLQQESIKQYEAALKLASESVLAERSGYKIFPLTALIEIHLKQKQPEKVDHYHIQLLEHMQHADVEDVSYFLECREQLANHAMEAGDENTAASIWISNHDLYQQAKLDQETTDYLGLSLYAVRGFLVQHDMQAAGLLLKEIEGLAGDKKKKIIYLEYLAIKGKYCEMAADEDTGYEALVEGDWMDKLFSFFSKKSMAQRFADLANECYEDLKERSADRFGDTSYEHLNVLVLYGRFNMNHGKYDVAETTFQEVINTRLNLEQLDPAVLNRAKLLLMVCQMATRKEAFDIAVIKKMEEQLYSDAADKLLYFTEAERETFTNKLQEDIQLINAILLAANSKENADRIYNNVLAFKNLVLYFNTYWRNVTLNNSNQLFKNAYLKLLQERDTAAGNNLDVFIKEKQLISKVRSLPGYQPYNSRNFTVENIRQALEPGNSAVEYITAPDLQLPTKPITYYAIVVNPNSVTPAMLKLCTEDSLIKLLNRGGTLKEGIDAVYTYSLPQLKALLIAPVIKAADSASRLYISPSGLLHQVSFTALLQNSLVNFEIVGSTRQVVDKPTGGKGAKNAVVFGDINYGTSEEKEIKFKPLGFTRNEITKIGSVLQKDQYNVSLVSGDQATEVRFQQLSGKEHAILHLATHGFFDRTSMDESRVDNDQVSLFRADKPMSKCNLVFAGANGLKSTALNKYRDGLISAQEISTLDFSGVELVVLSACESGLGELTNFEGVQGFQRAFTMAGARYIVVTLWSISDKHTAELMGYFYDNIISGQKKSEALFNAQMTMKQIYRDPYYWAGYVLIKG